VAEHIRACQSTGLSDHEIEESLVDLAAGG